MTCFFLLAPSQAEVIDRIAVTVGKQVIAQSEVLQDLRVSAFLDQKPIDPTGENKRKSADRLVEQTLIRQEADFSRLALPPEDEATRMLAQVKADYGADYQAALVRYQISEQDVVHHLLEGLKAMHFSDLRFRPEVQISPDEVREFYDRMVSENPGKLPPFEESREQMEKLLVEQRVAQALDRWLGTQRTQTEILYRDQVFK